MAATLRGKVAVAGIGESAYYRHGKAPAKKTSTRKAQLFDAVLSSLTGAPPEDNPGEKGKK